MKLLWSKEVRLEGERQLGSEIREQLQALSSDVETAHDIDFYLYFPTVQATDQAASRLTAAGFMTHVTEGMPGSGKWLCLARMKMVPSETFLNAIGREFEAIVSELGGEFDGWETALWPEEA